MVLASIDSNFTNLILIHQNSPGVKRQGSSRIFFALFVSLFSLLVEEFLSRVYPLERKEGNKSEHLKVKGSFNSLFSPRFIGLNCKVVASKLFNSKSV